MVVRRTVGLHIADSLGSVDLRESVVDDMEAFQRVDFPMSEVRGVGTSGGVGVIDSRKAHKLLHLAHRQRPGSLQPQCHDACSHGRGHRRALHLAVGVGGIVDYQL